MAVYSTHRPPSSLVAPRDQSKQSAKDPQLQPTFYKNRPAEGLAVPVMTHLRGKVRNSRHLWEQ